VDIFTEKLKEFDFMQCLVITNRDMRENQASIFAHEALCAVAEGGISMIEHIYKRLK